ncbi:MAG: ankyrin repeat domain-containing protein [Alphaproteobacteria bacterium]
MSGGVFHLEHYSYKGMGGYKAGMPITPENLERVAMNSRDDNLYYSHNSNNDTRSYMVGYLFGVKTPAGQELNIDAHGMEFDIERAEGTIAQFGPILWQVPNGTVQDVTEFFWQRVHFLSEEALNHQERGYSKVQLPNFTGGQEDFTAIAIEKTADIKLNTSGLKNLIANPLDGLVTSQDRYQKSPVANRLVQQLRQITGAQQIENLVRPPADALSKFTFADKDEAYKGRKILETALSNKFSYYVSTIIDDIGENYFYVTKQLQGYFGAKAPNFHGLERMLGKQGEAVDEQLIDYHTKLCFTSREKMIAAIEILTRDDEAIINPLNILARGHDLYLTGQINHQHLQAIWQRAENPLVAVALPQASSPLQPAFANNIPAPTPEREFDYSSRTGTRYALRYLFKLLLPKELYLDLEVDYSYSSGQRYEYSTELEVIIHNEIEGMGGRIKYNILREAFDLIARVSTWHNTQFTVDEEFQAHEPVKGVRATIPARMVATLLQTLTNHKDCGRLTSYIFRTFEAASIADRENILSTDNIAALVKTTTPGSIVAAAEVHSYQQSLITESMVEELKQAVQKKELDMVVNLVERGVDPVLGIYEAAATGYIPVLQYLLEAGADANGGVTPYTYGDAYIPLHAATQNNHVEAVRLLLRHGANPAQFYKVSRTPTMLAMEEGYTEILAELLPYGAHIRYDYNNHLVFEALEAIPAFAEYALQEKIYDVTRDPVKHNLPRDTFITAIASVEELAGNDALIAQAADAIINRLTIRDIDDALADTPLCCRDKQHEGLSIAEKENIAINMADQLLAAGANPNFIDYYPTAYNAFTKGMPNLGMKLIEFCDVNATNKYGSSAMMMASENILENVRKLSNCLQRNPIPQADVHEQIHDIECITQAVQAYVSYGANLDQPMRRNKQSIRENFKQAAELFSSLRQEFPEILQHFCFFERISLSEQCAKRLQAGLAAPSLSSPPRVTKIIGNSP